jgi:hypothetical protein
MNQMLPALPWLYALHLNETPSVPFNEEKCMSNYTSYNTFFKESLFLAHSILS